MCHPWLAAGVTCFVAALISHELASIARDSSPADASRDHGLLGARPRQWFRGRIRPLVDAALRLGLTADGATMLQLVSSLVCGIAYAKGWMFTAGWLLIACGTLDVLDGEMARRQGRDGPRGAFIDSVVDRYGESAVFGGLVVHYRSIWLLWPVLAAWAGGFLVSYTRARAGSLGIDCREGMLQRPERFVMLGGLSMMSTTATHLACNPNVGAGLMAAGLCTLAVLVNLTALQRTRAALRRLT